MANQDTITGIVETALYVEDLERSAAFYQDLFGFEQETRGPLICVLRVPGRQALILFSKAINDQPPGRPPFAVDGEIPPHGAGGRMHVAFGIKPEELEPWRERLKSRGVAAEGKVHWQRGGDSLFFRDPDNHLIELITPGLWSFY